MYVYMDISKQHNYCCILVFNRARRGQRANVCVSVWVVSLRRWWARCCANHHNSCANLHIWKKKSNIFLVYTRILYVHATAYYIRARHRHHAANGCLNMGSCACIRREERMDMGLAEDRPSALAQSARNPSEKPR